MLGIWPPMRTMHGVKQLHRQAVFQQPVPAARHLQHHLPNVDLMAV